MDNTNGTEKPEDSSPSPDDESGMTEPLAAPVDLFVAELLACDDREKLLAHYCQKYPSQAEQFRSAIRFEGDFAQGMQIAAGPPIGPDVDALLPRSFDDFNIIRIVAKGGMGTVFEAQQLSLQRRVAIKTLRHEHARPRFLNEQKCLAQFYQANIVPLYQTGQCDNIPYLVMPFIDGATLSRVISTAKWSRRHTASAASIILVLIGIAAAITGLALHSRSLGIVNSQLNRTLGQLTTANSKATHALTETQRRERRIRRFDYATHMALAFEAYGNANVGLTANLLGRNYTLDDGTDLRGWEWYLLNGICQDDDMTFSGHRVAVTSVAYGKHGKVLFTGDASGVLKIWDRKTGTCKQSVDAHSGAINAIAIDLDGTHIATGGEYDGLIKIWQSSDWQLAQTLNAHILGVTAIRHHPTAPQWVTAGRDGAVFLWSDTGDEQAMFEHPSEIRYVDYSSDGATLAVALPRAIWVWNTASKQCVRKIASPAELNAVRFSPGDNVIVAAGSGNKCLAWSVDTGQEQGTIETQPQDVRDLAFVRSQNALLTVNNDNTVKMYGLQYNRLLRSFRGHRDNVSCIALHPNGTECVTGSADNTVKAWNLRSSRAIHVLAGHKVQVTGLAFGPSGRHIVSSSYDQSVRVWDPSMNQLLQTMGKQTVERDPATGNVTSIASHSGHTSLVMDVAFASNGGRVASASFDKTARIWDANTGATVATLKHRGEVVTVCFSHDGKLLATGSWDDSVYIWDVDKARIVHVLNGHTGHTVDVTFSPDDSQLASASWDGTVKIWDMAKWQLKQTLRGHRGKVLCVAYNSAGTQIASGGEDQTIRITDVETGRLIMLLQGHSGAVADVAFHPTTQRLVSGTSGPIDRTVRIWDLGTGEQTARLAGQAPVAISPDGKQLAFRGTQNTINVWDAQYGKGLETVLPNEPVPPAAENSEIRLPADGGLRTLGYYIADKLPDLRKKGQFFEPADGKQFLVVMLSAPQKLFMPPAPVYERLADAAKKKGELIAAADRIAIYSPAMFELQTGAGTDQPRRAATCLSFWPDAGGFFPGANRSSSEPLKTSDRYALGVAWEVDALGAEPPDVAPLRISWKGLKPVSIVQRRLQTVEHPSPIPSQ